MTDYKQCAHLLKVPAEIMEMIFGYLSDEDIYFNVRIVCQSLKELTERFIRLGKINNLLLFCTFNLKILLKVIYLYICVCVCVNFYVFII
jgi:hypothetical protein